MSKRTFFRRRLFAGYCLAVLLLGGLYWFYEEYDFLIRGFLVILLGVIFFKYLIYLLLTKEKPLPLLGITILVNCLIVPVAVILRIVIISENYQIYLLYTSVPVLEGILIAVFNGDFFIKKVLKWIGLCLIAFGGLFLFFQILTSGSCRRPPISSRVESDMRHLAVGLESYYIEHGHYPQNLSRLTTPIAYLADIPHDSLDPQKRPYRYYVKDDFWVLVSCGPEKRLRFYPGDFDKMMDNYSDDMGKVLHKIKLLYTYDPTNGSISRGDIIRTRQ